MARTRTSRPRSIADPLAAGASIATARQLQGKELSYNNIADADAALECVRQFDAPACVIVKHANPCGAAVAADTLDGLRARLRSRTRHPRSAASSPSTGRSMRERPPPSSNASSSRSSSAPSCAPGRPRGARREAEHPRARDRPAGRRRLAPSSSSNRVAGGLLVQSRDDGIVDSRDAEAGHAPRAGCVRARRPPVRLANLQVREVERDRLRARRAHGRHRCGTDEPRRVRPGSPR